MRSARSAARAEGAGHPPAGPRHPPAVGLPNPTAGTGAVLAASAAWPLAICVVWAALALRSPQATYHLMRFVASAAWPVSVRLAIGAPLARRMAVALAGGSLALTLAAAAVLGLAGALSGLSLWHGNGALETPLAAAAGAVWGWRVAARSGRGIVGRLT